MARMSAHTRGLARLNAWAASQPKLIQEAIRTTNEKNANKFARSLRKLIPISDDNVHIRDAIQVDKSGRFFAYTVAFGDARNPFAAALEFGHTGLGHPVQGIDKWLPLVRKAKRAHRRALIRAMKKAMVAHVMAGGAL